MDIRKALDEDVKKIPFLIRVRHSLWALWSFIPLFGGAFAFFNLSLKDYEEKKTALWGFFYLIPLVLVMSGTSIVAEKDAKNGIVALFWIAGIFHAFIRRSDHLKNMVASAWAVGNPENQSSELADPVQGHQLTSNEEQEPDDLDALLVELQCLIGLDGVKKKVKDLIDYLNVQKMREAQGKKASSISMNMVFYGNPGTGKTTAAKLLGKIYKALGVVSKGSWVRTGRDGLVGEYLGKTSLKVKDVVESAVGGVLFIDEAYSLTEGGDQDLYGREAVTELVKLIDDHKDDLVVIVAGYTDKMNEFLSSNPGMKSRFNAFFYFDDYTPNQLLQIFEGICKKNEYRLSPSARDCVLALFKRGYESKDETLGNARFAENVFKDAISKQASRITSMNKIDPDVITLEAEDIPFDRPDCVSAQNQNSSRQSEVKDIALERTDIKTFISSLKTEAEKRYSEKIYILGSSFYIRENELCIDIPLSKPLGLRFWITDDSVQFCSEGQKRYSKAWFQLNMPEEYHAPSSGDEYLVYWETDISGQPWDYKQKILLERVFSSLDMVLAKVTQTFRIYKLIDKTVESLKQVFPPAGGWEVWQNAEKLNADSEIAFYKTSWKRPEMECGGGLLRFSLGAKQPGFNELFIGIGKGSSKLKIFDMANKVRLADDAARHLSEADGYNEDWEDWWLLSEPFDRAENFLDDNNQFIEHVKERFAKLKESSPVIDGIVENEDYLLS